MWFIQDFTEGMLYLVVDILVYPSEIEVKVTQYLFDQFMSHECVFRENVQWRSIIRELEITKVLSLKNKIMDYWLM